MTIFQVVTLLFLLSMVNAAIAILSLKGFLAQHYAIDSLNTFNTFKDVIRKQQYQALLQMGLLFPMSALVVYGIFTDRLSGKEFITSLAYNGVIFVVGKIAKKYEEPARSMRVNDPEMEEQYTAVCNSWQNSALPNF